MKNQDIRVNCLKRKAWTVFRFKGGSLANKNGVMVLRGLIPQYTQCNKITEKETLTV